MRNRKFLRKYTPVHTPPPTRGMDRIIAPTASTPYSYTCPQIANPTPSLREITVADPSHHAQPQPSPHIERSSTNAPSPSHLPPSIPNSPVSTNQHLSDLASPSSIQPSLDLSTPPSIQPPLADHSPSQTQPRRSNRVPCPPKWHQEYKMQ